MYDLIDRQGLLNKICDGCGYIGYCHPDGKKCVEYERVENMSSVQPEIIRCKDCKWKQGSECVRFAYVRPFPGDYCSRAERRTNGCLNQQKSGD